MASAYPYRLDGVFKKVGPHRYKVYRPGTNKRAIVELEDRMPGRNYCELCGRGLNKNNQTGYCSQCIRKDRSLGVRCFTPAPKKAPQLEVVLSLPAISPFQAAGNLALAAFFVRSGYFPPFVS